jgi:ankyrin repeat protein
MVNCTNDNCSDDDIRRSTPLTYAARDGHVEVVQVLLEGGAKVDRADIYSSTALHTAAWYGRLEVCRLLLDWGAKVDALNRWKNTPLHNAAKGGYLSVVQLLVKRGADSSLKNDKNQTASDVARSDGKEDVAVCLDLVSHGYLALIV